MMVISPDEGGTSRAIYFANMLGLDMGMFYKRRDYTKIVNGRNPIVAHEFLGSSVEGKDVLIVEDIVDSGITLKYLMSYLSSKGASSVEIVTLLNKSARRAVNVNVKYIGFEAPDGFLVGYGLDYAEKYRNLPFIGILKEEIYS